MKKYVTLHIYDDEDVQIMICAFDKQNGVIVLEMYVEKDVVDCSTIP